MSTKPRWNSGQSAGPMTWPPHSPRTGSPLSASAICRTHRPPGPGRRVEAVTPIPVSVAGGPPRTLPSGQQGQWINEALRVLRENGYDTRHISAADIATIIQHESGGNPDAINLWDGNAGKGFRRRG
ncbi:hypothetical protein ACW2Q0_03775 [Nocardia sp. R16R-3T]